MKNNHVFDLPNNKVLTLHIVLDKGHLLRGIHDWATNYNCQKQKCKLWVFNNHFLFGQFEMSCSGSLRTDGWAISTFFVLFTDPLSSISYSKGCSKYLVTVFCIVLLSNHKKEGFELTLYRLLPCYETLESSLESCNVKVPVWSTSNVWSWVE